MEERRERERREGKEKRERREETGQKKRKEEERGRSQRASEERSKVAARGGQDWPSQFRCHEMDGQDSSILKWTVLVRPN